jgi:hypothetical protein
MACPCSERFDSFNVSPVKLTNFLIGQYHFGVQLVSLCVIAPVIATKWQAVLRTQIRYITPGWYDESSASPVHGL